MRIQESDTEQMRICFASMWYPPFPAGGAGVYAECLCQELAKLGHEVHVITPRFGCERREGIEKGVVVHRIPVINKQWLWIPCYWLSVRSYCKVLRRKMGGFDVLHGNVNSDISLTKDVVSEPRVVTLHHLGRTAFERVNPSLFELIRNLGGELGLASWIEKNTLDFDKVVTRRADKVITVSEFCKQEIVTKYGLPSSKISVIQNGVYPEDYVYSKHEAEAMRKRLGDNDDFLVLFVGRLERRKGLSLLLKAFKLVSRSERAKLIVVGSGRQAPYRQLAESLSIGKKVVFVGSVDDATLRRIYGACDLFASSSYLEGFGITLLEAMASEKPVVAMNAGGIGEVIKDGVHGKLVSNMNCKELADAILHFAQNRESIRAIGMQNRRYVMENFSWSKSAKLTEKLYESLA